MSGKSYCDTLKTSISRTPNLASGYIMADLVGKVALISGGARGQGEAAARLFVTLGAKVIIGDVLGEQGQKLADELGAYCFFQSLDVTSGGDWQRAVKFAVECFGKLDVLVNNAGIIKVGTIETMSEQDFMDVIRVNQLGCFLGMKAAIPALRESGNASIINISSSAGIEGVPGVSAYVGTKFAIRGITKSAALELGHDGIRVNSVHPGFIDTPMVNTSDFDAADKEGTIKALAIPRVGQPGDVAKMVAFLASDDSDYCTGAEFLVDGGAMAGGPLPIEDD